jgi:hypothetical protein
MAVRDVISSRLDASCHPSTCRIWARRADTVDNGWMWLSEMLLQFGFALSDLLT